MVRRRKADSAGRDVLKGKPCLSQCFHSQDRNDNKSCRRRRRSGDGGVGEWCVVVIISSLVVFFLCFVFSVLQEDVHSRG